MKKKIKILIIISIIAILLLIGALYYRFFIHIEPKEQQNENQVKIENIQEQNNVVNEEEINTVKSENVITEEPVEKEPEKQEVKNENNEIIGKEEQESNIVNEGKSEEENAIQLVKEKWGEQDITVIYTIANRENSIYMISVTDKETTAVLAWYQVNMTTGEIIQQ